MCCHNRQPHHLSALTQQKLIPFSHDMSSAGLQDSALQSRRHSGFRNSTVLWQRHLEHVAFWVPDVREESGEPQIGFLQSQPESSIISACVSSDRTNHVTPPKCRRVASKCRKANGIFCEDYYLLQLCE